jgi:Toxin co-regulated pilus biosynthesis protein Q
MDQGSKHMSQPFSRIVSSSGRQALALGAALFLQACAAPKATDMADNWRPINSLAAKPQEIPLKEEAELPRFQMLPTDATLRHMLERWAKENGGTLDWQYPSDLTLVSGLETVKDNNLQRALNSVRRNYAAQKLRIQMSASRSMLVTKMP